MLNNSLNLLPIKKPGRQKKSKICRKGLTLVEVVTGIAILSTLLVGILLAFKQHSTQIKSAQKRMEAIEMADDLLREWSLGGWSVPFAGDSGRVEGHKNLYWRMTDSTSEVPVDLNARILRLEIVQKVTSGEDRILSSVELLAEGTRTASSVQFHRSE